METIEIEGKQYEVIGHDASGVPTIRGVATQTQDGVDKNGTPKINVNVSVPPITIGVVPGEIK
jgi:hypothetical protein